MAPVGEAGHHFRPIHPDDTELDMIAVMGSQERLWGIYGDAWGWPPATMTAEQDREDLARHAQEMEDHESFNYALFDGMLLSPYYYAVTYAVLMAAAVLGFRVMRTTQMVTQYRWLYERTSPLTWKSR